jgi:hypothetical protein
MVTLYPAQAASIALLLAALASDFWVLTDARTRAKQGKPAQANIGNLRLNTPEAWFLACVALWPIFLPLYLTATGRNPFTRPQP